MNIDHPPIEPDIAVLVSEVTERLQSIRRQLGSGEARNRSAVTEPIRDIAIDSSKLYAMVESLSGAGDFRNALPLAVQLFMQNGGQPRAAYLLASCLQRLGRPNLAVSIFGYCTELESNDPTPGPLFRVGECLASMGWKEQAIDAFDATIELARSDVRNAAIQQVAQAKVDALRAAQ